jgi:hypothetical protein
VKRINFNNNNHSDDLLHIEIPGAVVNIYVNLRDRDGREVNRVDIIPDDESRGGDASGHVWDVDHNDSGTVTRLIRRERV